MKQLLLGLLLLLSPAWAFQSASTNGSTITAACPALMQAQQVSFTTTSGKQDFWVVTVRAHNSASGPRDIEYHFNRGGTDQFSCDDTVPVDSANGFIGLHLGAGDKITTTAHYVIDAPGDTEMYHICVCSSNTNGVTADWMRMTLDEK